MPSRRLLPLLRALACAAALWAGTLPLRAAGPPDAVNLDKDWRLLLDPNAPWRDDPLFLPDEIADLAKLPLNQPSGGWTALDDRAGIGVSLPATVEQFYWGKAPNKVADPKRTEDVVTFDGIYQGVSWWYRSFLPPDLKPGQRLVLNLPGARLRAEVYLNGQLVGYHLIAETPFSADLTPALLPGAPNQLAVRITNPGGNLTGADDSLIPWGKYGIPVSHGFGGLDGGVTLAVRAGVAVSDLAVANHTDPRAVTITAEVSSSGPDYDGPVVFSILRDGKEVWTGTAAVQVPAHGSESAIVEARLAGAELWDFSHPQLYTARARLAAGEHTARETTFGFRWFAAESIGRDAQFQLNRHRVMIRSADSWGFWAPNGMFPDRAAAERETAAAQALGLNALQNSRHYPKPVVLDACDRAGLGRWCEPGAGIYAVRLNAEGGGLRGSGPIDPSGEGGPPPTWFNRYETAKILGMISADRSHPSVLGWTLQSGRDPGDLHNPRVFATLRRMHDLDPTRLVILKSGPGSANQVWIAPYETEFQLDNGKGGSGWHDEQTANSCPGVPAVPPQAVAGYQDDMYRGADQFSYHSANEKEVTIWGAATAGASADNHAEISRWYEQHNLSGYDRAAHDVLADAYEKALDRYDLRKAFPTPAALFRQIATKQYFLAARLLENARLSNANDGFTLAGWESTTVDGHAGLVDAWRQPKGDPAVIKAANAPALLVIRPRHAVLARGEEAVIDVHLINEANLRGDFTLVVSAAGEGSGSKPFFEQKFPVTAAGGNRYGELLKDGIAVTPPNAGLVTVTASLLSVTGQTLPPGMTRSAPLLVVDPNPEPIKKTVAVVPGSAPIAAALAQQLGVTAGPLEEARGKVDDLLVDTNLWQSERLETIAKADDPNLYEEQSSCGPGEVLTVRDLAPGPVQVELFFAETHWERAGQRVFDVALNGNTVLERFDILHAAGDRRGVGVVRTFTAESRGGALQVSVPRVDADRALFAAIRVTDAKHKVVAEVFRAHDYTGNGGQQWLAAELPGFDWKPVLPGLLERVRAGSRLIVLSSGGADAAQNAAAFAEAKLLVCNGAVGQSGPSSQGFWYFGKKHWLLEGLPSNCVFDWPYQITSGDGLLLSGPGMEAVVAFGRDHAVRVGVGAAVFPHGKGQIVLLDLQNLEASFVHKTALGFHPVTARRILYNALR